MIIGPRNIEIFGTYDRAVPNRERIVLRVNQPTSLDQYMVILGLRAPMGADRVLPIPDSSFWLGNTFIEVPSWIFIFTGHGTSSVSQETHTKQPVHSLYWGKNYVALTHHDIVPALIHIDSLEIGNRPNKNIGDVQNGLLDMDVAKLYANPNSGS